MAEQSLEQKRAKHALSCTQNLTNAGNYTSYVKSLPPTILQIGLGQTLATIRSREGNDKGYEHLYAHLTDWLTQDWLTQKCPHKPDRIGNDLLAFIAETDEDTYLRLQDETMAYLRWLKKFAVAFAKEEQPEEKPDAPSDT